MVLKVLWIKTLFIKLTNCSKHSLILAKTGIEVHLMHEFDSLGFQNNKLKLDFKTTKVVGKSLGSPRTSLERKALGDLMGIIKWLILYG